MIRLLDIDVDDDECSALFKMNSQKSAIKVRVEFSKALNGELSKYREFFMGCWCIGNAFTFAFDNNLEALDKALDWIRTFVYKSRELQESKEILNSVGMKIVRG
jgi:hypothetical protein